MSYPIQVLSEKADKTSLNAETFCPTPKQNSPNFIMKADKGIKKSRSKEDHESSFNPSAQESLAHCTQPSKYHNS